IPVSSGWGLHVYWPLKHMLDRATWERYARGLKSLCEKHGLKADPSRTADISSVLRTPGTHNRKRNKEQLVECDPGFLDIEPYAIEKFSVLLEYGDAPSPKWAGVRNFTRGPVPTYLANRRSPKIAEDILEGLVVYEPSSGARISEQCGQLRAL